MKARVSRYLVETLVMKTEHFVGKRDIEYSTKKVPPEGYLWTEKKSLILEIYMNLWNVCLVLINIFYIINNN